MTTMSRVSESDSKSFGDLLRLINHDLRNPVAALSAHVSFLAEVCREGTFNTEDVQDCLVDAQTSIEELCDALNQLGVIGRWYDGQFNHQEMTVDLYGLLTGLGEKYQSVEIAYIPKSGTVFVKDGAKIVHLMQLLIRNCLQNRIERSVGLSAEADSDVVSIELSDDGPQFSPDLKDMIFSPTSQHLLQGRADGRYSKYAGLGVAGILTQMLGGTIDTFVRDGMNVIRVEIPYKSAEQR